MPISVANITSGLDEDGGSSSSTASVTPNANKLQLLTVASRTGITADPNQPTVTGNGLTWVAINSIVYDSTSSSRRRVTTFRALGASPSAGAITIDFGGQAQTDVTWILDEVSGMDISGTNGSGAIVQSVTGKDEGGSATSLSITLAAFESTSNATYGAFSWDGSTSTGSQGSGFTLVKNQNDSGIDLSSLTEFRSDNDTSVDSSYSPAVGVVGGIAIEIRTGAFPTVLSSTSQQFSTDATAHNVTMPATVNVGDILIVQFTCYANTFNGYTPTTTPPSGWTEFVDLPEATGPWAYNSLYAKIADGSEDGASVDFVTSDACPAVAIVTRIQAGTYYSGALSDIFKAASASQSTGEPNPPSLTHGWGAVDFLAGACMGGGDQDTVTGWPTGFSANQVQANCGGSHPGSGDQSCAASALRNVTAASIDPSALP